MNNESIPWSQKLLVLAIVVLMVIGQTIDFNTLP